MNEPDTSTDHEYDNKNQTFLFIHCMFKNIENHGLKESAIKCGEQFFVDNDDVFNAVFVCGHSPDGDAALKNMAAKQLKLKDPLEHVPWIVINGRQSQEAETDLTKVICDNHRVSKYFIIF